MRIGRLKIRVANPTPATYSLWGRRSSISALGVLSRGNHFWKVINGAPFLHPLESKTHLYLRIYFALSLVNTRQDPIIAAKASCFHEKWGYRPWCQGCMQFRHLLIQSATNRALSRFMSGSFNEAGHNAADWGVYLDDRVSFGFLCF